MEVASGFVGGGLAGGGEGTRAGNVWDAGTYFAGFGLAVGAALGMTEGLVRKNRVRLWYGFVMGLFLGTVGGYAGGIAGQAIYGMVPLRYASSSNADIVLTLDASQSMGGFLSFGANDRRGRRKKAARQLIARLSSGDRVGVVEFHSFARTLFPLTPLSVPGARGEARRAVNAVGSEGGTSLDAGLTAAFEVLAPSRGDGRPKHVIFLTDGVGEYSPQRFPREATAGVTVHTVGLGNDVDAGLLGAIAASTGGEYYPVSEAADLVAVFDRIFDEHVALTDSAPEDGAAELLTPGWVILALRTVSWGIVGTVIGLGQGVAYNTREDLRACTLGGLGGGLLGGAVFDPVSALTGIGGGLLGRALADGVVGAAIGGSMKLVQGALVDKPERPTTALLDVLPAGRGIRMVTDGTESGLTDREKRGATGLEARRRPRTELEDRG